MGCQEGPHQLREAWNYFKKAAEAFLDPYCAGVDTSPDLERRALIVGYTLAQRLLLVVYEERSHVTRIISARNATRAERMLYEQF